MHCLCLRLRPVVRPVRLLFRHQQERICVHGPVLHRMRAGTNLQPRRGGLQQAVPALLHGRGKVPAGQVRRAGRGLRGRSGSDLRDELRGGILLRRRRQAGLRAGENQQRGAVGVRPLPRRQLLPERQPHRQGRVRRPFAERHVRPRRQIRGLRQLRGRPRVQNVRDLLHGRLPLGRRKLRPVPRRHLRLGAQARVGGVPVRAVPAGDIPGRGGSDGLQGLRRGHVRGRDRASALQDVWLRQVPEAEGQVGVRRLPRG